MYRYVYVHSSRQLLDSSTDSTLDDSLYMYLWGLGTGRRKDHSQLGYGTALLLLALPW